MNQNYSNGVSVIRPDQVSAGTSQTSGSQRQAAISKQTGVSSSMWGGTFLVKPGAQTGIHHHGSQETIVYVLEGESIVQWGDKGEHSVTVRTGDFLHVPPGLIHREINPSKQIPFRWIVVRSSSEPIVVNLPDDAWD
ncbi:MAG: cupin domain-containing protein [Acidobacteria bacterium]|nr:cupin domain-containing protein [Acidobacteriota bacterium]